MEWDLLSDVTSRALAAALRGGAARQAALAHNISNLDTPGFVRVEVEFEAALAAALAQARRGPSRSQAGELNIAPRYRRDLRSPARADGNNVDPDREMVALARNTLSQRAASQMLASRIRMLRAAIGQGRR